MYILRTVRDALPDGEYIGRGRGAKVRGEMHDVLPLLRPLSRPGDHGDRKTGLRAE